MFKRQRIDNRGIKGGTKKNGFPKKIKKETKRHLILEDIASGLTYTEIVNKYVEEWGLSVKTVQGIVDESVSYMRSQEAKDSILAMNMQRLESIITDSMKDADRKNAIKAIDTQNKVVGGYTQNVVLQSDSDINFVFDIGE